MSEDICDGVKILVERMKTNPEEFAADYGKWDGLIKSAWHEDVTDWVAALNPTEIEMLKEARRKIYRERFTAQVMRTLLKTDDAPTLTPKVTITTQPNHYLAQNTYNPYQNAGVNTATGGGGIGGAGTWVTTGTNTVVTESMVDRFQKAWNEYKDRGRK